MRGKRLRGILLVRGDNQMFSVVHQQAGNHAAHSVHEERLHRSPTPRPHHRPVHHTHLEGKRHAQVRPRPSSNPTLAWLLCTWPCSSRDGFSSSCFVTSW